MTYLLSKPIVIAGYDPQWPLAYETERKRLLAVLQSIAVQIEHIGSTAVPGLAAKPIIDISVSVRALDEVNNYISALQSLGYTEQPIDPRFERRLFCRGPYNEGTHHLHFTVHESAVWAEPLLFRNYLRAHPTVAQAYAQVKQTAATRHANDLNGYHDHKAVFVTAIMAQARVWHAT